MDNRPIDRRIKEKLPNEHKIKRTKDPKTKDLKTKDLMEKRHDGLKT